MSPRSIAVNENAGMPNAVMVTKRTIPRMSVSYKRLIGLRYPAHVTNMCLLAVCYNARRVSAIQEGVEVI